MIATLIGSFILIGIGWTLTVLFLITEIKRLNGRIELLTQMGRRQRTIIRDLYSPQSKENENNLIH